MIELRREVHKMLGFLEFIHTFFFFNGNLKKKKKAVPLAGFWGHMRKQLAGPLCRRQVRP